jgi:hypothetical protein
MTTIYECAFCDNKTSNVSDWGIDFDAPAPAPEPEDKEIRGFCIKCDQEGKFIGKEGDEWTCPSCEDEDEEDSDEEGDGMMECLECKGRFPTTIISKWGSICAPCFHIHRKTEEECKAMKIDAERKAATYNPLEGLNARQIERIFRLRAEREAKKIANRKYHCPWCDVWSDTKLRAVPDSKKKICDECFEDSYFECFDCEKVQNQQDEDYHKIAHPGDSKSGKLVCVCVDCYDNRKNIGTCGDCAKWFDEGKDFCKCCGFDLNSYNQE